MEAVALADRFSCAMLNQSGILSSAVDKCMDSESWDM
jgi:hypothetical protein